jgi:hypothetical protein
MRWEYKTFNFTKRNFFGGTINAEVLQVQLNELGRDGWELVSVTQNAMASVLVTLKRST